MPKLPKRNRKMTAVGKRTISPQVLGLAITVEPAQKSCSIKCEMCLASQIEATKRIEVENISKDQRYQR